MSALGLGAYGSDEETEEQQEDDVAAGLLQGGVCRARGPGARARTRAPLCLQHAACSAAQHKQHARMHACMHAPAPPTGDGTAAAGPSGARDHSEEAAGEGQGGAQSFSAAPEVRSSAGMSGAGV